MITHGEIECPLCAELAKEHEALGLRDRIEELEALIEELEALIEEREEKT